MKLVGESFWTKRAHINEGNILNAVLQDSRFRADYAERGGERGRVEATSHDGITYRGTWKGGSDGGDVMFVHYVNPTAKTQQLLFGTCRVGVDDCFWALRLREVGGV